MDIKYYDVQKVETIKQMLEMAVEQAGDKIAFKYKAGKDKVVDVTYKEFQEDTFELGTALNSINMADKHIAVIGDNCYKYVTVYLTVLKSKGVFVPIDKELPVYDIINVLNDSDSEVLFYAKKYEKDIEEIASKAPNVKYFIGFDVEKSEDENDKTEKENPDDVLERIAKLEVKISDLTTSAVYKVIEKKHITLVREPIKKTNVVLKNVNFQYAMKLWSYLRENMDDKTSKTDEKKNYDDEGDLKGLMDDSFFLNYLIMNTIDKDKEDEVENEEKKQETQNIIINKMLEKVISIDTDISMQDLKNMVGEKYAVIKYRNQASLQEIQNIFTKHINKYLENTTL